MCTASESACIWRASTVSGCVPPPGSASVTCCAKTSTPAMRARGYPSREFGSRSAPPSVLAQPAGELVVGSVGRRVQPGDELVPVLPGQHAVQRAEEDRAVREPERPGDDGRYEVV